MNEVMPSRPPAVRFEPTAADLVSTLLKMARVNQRDTVFDLGSGDGRIVITAARDFGARGVGIEIDPRLVARARENARSARVAGKVRFVHKDLFEADIHSATVVTLFLLPEVNLLLRSKLLRDLKPGARIVSNTHDMADWKPDRTRCVMDRVGWYHNMHLWTVPDALRVSPARDRTRSAGAHVLRRR
jgi:trans-aconitate methyltransferase